MAHPWLHEPCTHANVRLNTKFTDKQLFVLFVRAMGCVLPFLASENSGVPQILSPTTDRQLHQATRTTAPKPISPHNSAPVKNVAQLLKDSRVDFFMVPAPKPPLRFFFLTLPLKAYGTGNPLLKQKNVKEEKRFV